MGDDANIEELAAGRRNRPHGLKATDPSNHSKYAQLADVAPKLTAVLARGVGAIPNSKGNLPEGGALGAIVELPTTPLNAPIRIISCAIIPDALSFATLRALSDSPLDATQRLGYRRPA